MPPELDPSTIDWLLTRGYGESLSMEEDFIMRIYRHYRK